MSTDFNVRVAEKGEIRKNVIQISGKKVSFLWDVNENKEIIFCENQRQFFNYDTFVHTGMLPHCYSTTSKVMKQAKFVSMNEQGTVLVRPCTLE